ncbi:MAG: SCO6880 family protein [Jatrophihabitans sp.]|uniref:SCO6880 family protein n=1 Tax=Jatrophihabitans sp. TaxID=1932789 RepID=UPI003F7E31C4
MSDHDLTGEVVRYGGWSKDRHRWLLGLSGTAVAVLAVAAIPILLAAANHRWAVAAAALAAWLAVAAMVGLPIRGRSPARWGIDAALHTWGRARGWSDWQSRAAAGTADDLAEADLPGVLAGVRVHDGPPLGALLTRPAIVADHREQTWALVARLSHPGIGLAGPAARARMGAGLAELLEGAATSELASTIALHVRTAPEDGAERAAWHDRHLHPGAPDLVRHIESELAAIVTAAAVRHELFLTVVVPEHRLARPGREAGGGIDGRARVLYGLLGELEARLLGPVGCTAVTWLDTPTLAAAIRTGFAPGDRADLTHTHDQVHSVGEHGSALLPVAAAGPTNAPAAARRHYRHDAWDTATCTVLLPDKGAVLGALAPLLAPSSSGERRSATVFFEPIPAHRADRLVGADALSADLANEVRLRSGFRLRAAHRLDASRVASQDQRLADGSALVRVAVAAAVTIPSTSSIVDHARRLEADITSSGFVPLRLDLAQDSGFAAACLPLGIGLPRRRSTA